MRRRRTVRRSPRLRLPRRRRLTGDTLMSTSNRARRMAQHHARHRADAELNLIPLIDILSTLVAFLLVYSTEVEVIQNSKGSEIPQSIAEQMPRQSSVVVMITKTDLF